MWCRGRRVRLKVGGGAGVGFEMDHGSVRGGERGLGEKNTVGKRKILGRAIPPPPPPPPSLCDLWPTFGSVCLYLPIVLVQ